jgi:hypothetical protein
MYAITQLGKLKLQNQDFSVVFYETVFVNWQINVKNIGLYGCYHQKDC